MGKQIKKPSFREALYFWVKLGFISFGGPAGQIAIMHEFLVDKKRWISDSRFLHALNYTMVLPGPEAQQLATYIGWLLHGLKGGLVAGIFFVLPSMFILLGLSILYAEFGNIPWVYSIFNGLKPAVMAIVILALVKIGKKSLHTPFHYIMALAAFICIFFLDIPFPLIILSALSIGFMAQYLFPGLLTRNMGTQNRVIEELDDYYINSSFEIPNAGLRLGRLARQILTAVVLLFIPLALFYFFSSDFVFWQELSFFFTKAAFVTFGGAYAVLPYVAQVSVEQLHWLTELQMIDGLALGETTPGPLVMVLVFVGFMAGYNHYDGSILMGSLGLVTSTFYTFVPCFLFIFAGAPIIEKTRESPKIKQALGLVTAAVVGVILNLTIYLGRAVVFPEGLALSQMDLITAFWILASFIAMYRYKIEMIPWIGISAVFGLLRFLLS